MSPPVLEIIVRGIKDLHVGNSWDPESRHWVQNGQQNLGRLAGSRRCPLRQ